MNEGIRNLFKSLAPLSDAELDEALQMFHIVSVGKNEFFNRAGLISERIGFVNSGLLRSFYEIGGKETTTFFLRPGSVAASLLSFLRRKPAIENVQALEDSELIVISRKNLFNLYEENWKWQQVGRRLIENYYIIMEQRSISLQTKTAKERYQDFMEDYPEVLISAPQNQIASFLGIAPETLSRIRKTKSVY